MASRKILWGIPALLALHNLEEFFVMQNTFPGPVSKFPEWIQRFLPMITREQFALALILITIIPCLLLLFGQLTLRWRESILVLIQFQVVIFLNVFSHVIAAVMMGGFSPGIVTAILLNFPFSLLLFRYGLKNEWVRPKIFAAMFPIGLIVLGPGMLALLQLIIHVTGRF